MGDDKPEEVQEKPKTFGQKAADDHKKKYEQKKPEDMNEIEKKEFDAMEALNNGPTDDSNRSCQDIACCLLFIAFICGCVVVTAIGYKDGDPMKLTYIFDDDGVACGKKGGKAESFPYLYLYDAMQDVTKLDISTDILSKGFCVKACPSTYSVTILDCLPTAIRQNCNVSKIDIYLSEPFLDKLCVPSPDLYEQAKKDLKRKIQCTFLVILFWKKNKKKYTWNPI